MNEAHAEDTEGHTVAADLVYESTARHSTASSYTLLTWSTLNNRCDPITDQRWLIVGPLPPPPLPFPPRSYLPPSPSVSLSHTLATDCLSQQQQQLTSIQLCSHIGVCTIMLYGWRGEVVWIPLKRQSPDRRIWCFSIYLFVCLSVYLLCSIPVDRAYGAASVRFSFKLDMLWYLWGIVQELCESRGGRPGLSVLTSLLVSVDVKNYWTVLRHWSPLVPNMSTDIWGH